MFPKKVFGRWVRGRVAACNCFSCKCLRFGACGCALSGATLILSVVEMPAGSVWGDRYALGGMGSMHLHLGLGWLGFGGDVHPHPLFPVLIPRDVPVRFPQELRYESALSGGRYL